MLIDKRKLPMVEINFMNTIHEEDVDIINEMFKLILMYENRPTQISRQNIDVQYQKWFHHTVEHFQREEIRMKELNFPPYEIHKREHDHALAQMDSIFREWNNSKDIRVLKTYFIEVLPKWLVQHIESMDAVTAIFLNTVENSCSEGAY